MSNTALIRKMSAFLVMLFAFALGAAAEDVPSSGFLPPDIEAKLG